MSAGVADILCITQITFIIVHNALLANYGWFWLAHLEVLTNFATLEDEEEAIVRSKQKNGSHSSTRVQARVAKFVRTSRCAQFFSLVFVTKCLTKYIFIPEISPSKWVFEKHKPRGFFLELYGS